VMVVSDWAAFWFRFGAYCSRSCRLSLGSCDHWTDQPVTRERGCRLDATSGDVDVGSSGSTISSRCCASHASPTRPEKSGPDATLTFPSHKPQLIRERHARRPIQARRQLPRGLYLLAWNIILGTLSRGEVQSICELPISAVPHPNATECPIDKSVMAFRGRWHLPSK
jgi:hypothetical protein